MQRGQQKKATKPNATRPANTSTSGTGKRSSEAEKTCTGENKRQIYIQDGPRKASVNRCMLPRIFLPILFRIMRKNFSAVPLSVESDCRLAQNLVDDQVDVVLSWLHRHNDMRVPMSAPITHGPGAYLVLNSCEGQCIAKVYL